MKRFGVIVGAAIYLGTAASSAYAHHSHPYFYDFCKTVTVEGRVDKVEFKEPHSLVVLKTDDGTVYTVDWAPLGGLTRNGWLEPAKAALVSGTRIAVTGNPIRSGAEIRAHFPDFKNDPNPNTIDPLLIRRVDNSWSWAQKPSANPPDCKGK